MINVIPGACQIINNVFAINIKATEKFYEPKTINIFTNICRMVICCTLVLKIQKHSMCLLALIKLNLGF